MNSANRLCEVLLMKKYSINVDKPNIAELLTYMHYDYYLFNRDRPTKFLDILQQEKNYLFEIYDTFFYHVEFCRNYIKEFHKDYDLFMAGDSTFRCTFDEDNDKQTLSEIIAQNFNANILSLDWGGLSSILYQWIFTLIPTTKKRKIFIILFNLRSISDEWFLRPSYQFLHFRLIISLIRFYDSLKVKFKSPEDIFFAKYYYINYSDFLFNSTQYFINNILKSSEGYRSSLKCRSSFLYAFPTSYILNRLEPLKRSIYILTQKNYIPFVAITPINYMQEIDASELYLFQNNIVFIKKWLTEFDINFYDASMLLEPQYFHDAEHLLIDGRNIFACQLAEKINCKFKYNRGRIFNYFPIKEPYVRPEEMKERAIICKKA